MNALQIAGEIKKEMEIKEVPLKRLIRLLDCSTTTAYRKFRDPERFTVGDLEKIGSYLGMKLTFQ